MSTKQVNKQLTTLLMEMDETALAEVERLARKILKEHQNLNEFVMGMGMWEITRKIGTRDDSGGTVVKFQTTTESYGLINDVVELELAYLKPLGDFIDEWDSVLHLTGTPMRFTADGPVVTDW